MARHRRHAGLHAADWVERFRALFMAVSHRFYVEALLERRVLDCLAESGRCEEKPATQHLAQHEMVMVDISHLYVTVNVEKRK